MMRLTELAADYLGFLFWLALAAVGGPVIVFVVLAIVEHFTS